MTAPYPPWPLERVFFALVTRGWDTHKIASNESTLRKRDKGMSAEATHTFASIDAKATGLLTHMSMMIAGLGLGIRVAIVSTIVVFVMLPLLYCWTEKAA